MMDVEWTQNSDPVGLLRSAVVRPSTRKLRLFAVHCCRQNWEMFDDPRDRQAIQLAERLADGQASEADRVTAEKLLFEVRDDLEVDEECALLVPLCLVARELNVEDVSSCAWDMAARAEYTENAFEGLEEEMRHEQTMILRDLFGNPYRPVAFDPRWRTADVTALARAIYEDRAFDRLPVLADALMDAGCEDEQVIGHCRSEGPHVRGCWVVDLILGKE